MSRHTERNKALIYIALLSGVLWILAALVYFDIASPSDANLPYYSHRGEILGTRGEHLKLLIIHGAVLATIIAAFLVVMADWADELRNERQEKENK